MFIPIIVMVMIMMEITTFINVFTMMKFISILLFLLYLSS